MELMQHIMPHVSVIFEKENKMTPTDATREQVLKLYIYIYYIRTLGKHAYVIHCDISQL